MHVLFFYTVKYCRTFETGYKIISLLLILLLFVPNLILADPFKNKSIDSNIKDQVDRGNLLTIEDRERLKVCKNLLAGVDQKSFETSLRDLENSPNAHENLGILEAIAHTFAEIVKEQSVIGREKKEWLYSMITLNMAYLQLAGIDAKQPQDTSLDKLIRRKLKKYLSSDIKGHPKVFSPLE